jgi:hypothetical protein
MAARYERGSNHATSRERDTPRSTLAVRSRPDDGRTTSGRSATAGRPGLHQYRRAGGEGLVSTTLHAKLLSNIREIQARGAITIVIAEEADERVRPYADYLIEIPTVSTLFQPLLSTIPLQAFAASVAQAQGYDVDRPRNLAKSVIVE